ncbi:SPFH domain-containing protein [Silvibacterium dinghuense]|uniref:SPFH domain-containing protein n=2 Tax=Silvibacterium dinghuense TaxID=1560006 RepID=A0A4V1NW47_9BACT|nr:SPFH domain-containing protein [Silvibacterium dinghuense]GGG97727.1 membrane protein [Silvibacterium dinghuense]
MVTPKKGAPMLLLFFVLLIAVIALIVYAAANEQPIFVLPAVLLFLFDFIGILPGFYTLQPNEARVLVLFGSYKGTVRADGFFWGHPFYSNGARQTITPLTLADKAAVAQTVRRSSGRNKISLRARTLNGDILKVNDLRGNPIEIAAVVVWRVEDTAQALFDVDNFENYVATQSESALRHLANLYAYDDNNPNDTTLRRNVDEVSAALCSELTARLSKAGVAVDEARLTHLAYASEIAQVMLRSQQADAVIAARQKIVQGAVGMVDMALSELAAKHVVSLDDERRAAMVSNLMVVLCAESEVHPVVNAGTLYN